MITKGLLLMLGCLEGDLAMSLGQKGFPFTKMQIM